MSSTTAAEGGRLAGRVALVTGASRGIGYECARALLDEGMRVVMLARETAALRDAADGLGEGATHIGADLSRDVSETARLVRSRLPDAPDVIVNNAAEFFVAAAEATGIAAFERALRVNLSSHFGLVQTYLADMKRRGTGHIVTIGSIADERGLRGNAAYSASKFGLRGLHEVLREELRGSGIRVTLVSPARVDTTIWTSAGTGAGMAGGPVADAMIPARAVAEAVRYAVSQPREVNVDELRLSRA